MKFIKRMIVFILVLVVGLFVGLLLVANSIKQPLSEEVLPSDVYDPTINRDTAMLGLLAQMIIANDDARYTLVEEYINYLIYDSILNNVNSSYDPLGDLTSDEANRIVSSEYYYIDLVVATLNDDNQLVVDIGFGSDYLITVDSVVSLVFDINVYITELTLELALSSVTLGNHDISLDTLDFIVDRLDQTAIEDSITTGALNLDDYTYQVSLINP